VNQVVPVLEAGCPASYGDLDEAEDPELCGVRFEREIVAVG
jgi:hypothetical protein